MTKFESNVKLIAYPVEDVYRNISDLSNLERVRDRVPDDKLQDFQFDQDSVQVSVAPVGGCGIIRRVSDTRQTFRLRVIIHKMAASPSSARERNHFRVSIQRAACCHFWPRIPSSAARER